MGKEVPHAGGELKAAFTPVGLEGTPGLAVLRRAHRCEVGPNPVGVLRCQKIADEHHRHTELMGLLDALVGLQIRQIRHEHHHAFLLAHGIHVDLAEGEQTELPGDPAAGRLKVGTLLAAGAGTEHPLPRLKVNQLHDPRPFGLLSRGIRNSHLRFCLGLGLGLNHRFRALRSRFPATSATTTGSGCSTTSGSAWGGPQPQVPRAQEQVPLPPQQRQQAQAQPARLGLQRSLRNNSRRSVTKTGVGALVPDQPPQQAPEAEGQNSTHKGDHRTRHH